MAPGRQDPSRPRPTPAPLRTYPAPDPPDGTIRERAGRGRARGGRGGEPASGARGARTTGGGSRRVMGRARTSPDRALPGTSTRPYCARPVTPEGAPLGSGGRLSGNRGRPGPWALAA